jgi:hypothetical protein
MLAMTAHFFDEPIIDPKNCHSEIFSHRKGRAVEKRSRGRLRVPGFLATAVGAEKI